MDVKAAQTEALSKATAWLAQAVPAVETPAAPAPQEAPAQEPAPKVETPAPPPAPAKPGLTESILRDREKRTQAAAAQAEATKYKSELEEVKARLAAAEARTKVTDPFEFLRVSGMTKEQQALWGQAFLYDLKPEVAPQEFRLELYKHEQAQKEAAERAEAQRAKELEAQQQEHAHLARYADELVQHVQASPGSCPESELWFSEEGPGGVTQVNHKAYAQSLFATANNIAQRAAREGKQADLSPGNIARTLEAEVVKRLARRDAKRAGGAQAQQQVVPATPVQSGKQAVETAMSAQGLGGGPPLPPARTDEERRARAAAAMFSQK